MDLKEIKEVIKMMKSNDITDFELEREGFKIVLRKEQQNETPNIIQHPPAFFQPQQVHAPIMTHMPDQTQVSGGAVAVEEKKEDPNIDYILSPMVGTFYIAPSPESPPYVSTGQDIKIDDVVCILEAMKVFNEIKAEINGKIIEIMVENGAPVEFGQKLFKVKKI